MQAIHWAAFMVEFSFTYIITFCAVPFTLSPLISLYKNPPLQLALLSPGPLCLTLFSIMSGPLLISGYRSVTCPLLAPHAPCTATNWYGCEKIERAGASPSVCHHTSWRVGPIGVSKETLTSCLSAGVQPFNWFHTLIVLRDVWGLRLAHTLWAWWIPLWGLQSNGLPIMGAVLQMGLY